MEKRSTGMERKGIKCVGYGMEWDEKKKQKPSQKEMSAYMAGGKTCPTYKKWHW